MSSFTDLEFRAGFAGGCYVNGAATCVTQAEDYCDEGTFVTAHYVRANSGHPLRYCAGQIENVVIGRCGDSGRCSNLPSNCEDNSTFVKYDDTCTITEDLSSTTENTTYVTYGKCGDRCAWSPESCLEGETYISNDPECTADNVQIGACFAGHAFCAVGQSSCVQPNLPDEPFWSHDKVKEFVGANCFLSSLPLPPTTAPPTRVPWTRSPTVAPLGGFPSTQDVLPNDPNSNVFLDPCVVKSDEMLSTGWLVAIVAVVAVILGILIGVSTVYCKREEDDTWKVDTDKESSIPTAIIDINPSSEDLQIEYAHSSITDI